MRRQGAARAPCRDCARYGKRVDDLGGVKNYSVWLFPREPVYSTEGPTPYCIQYATIPELSWPPYRSPNHLHPHGFYS